MIAYSENETPTGAINGSNTIFLLANRPISSQLFLNGMFQTVDEDYTLLDKTITFSNAPLSGSILRIFYKF